VRVSNTECFEQHCARAVIWRLYDLFYQVDI
jgi:hypothetical protein